MTARAIWKGKILLAGQEVAVNMYSAVEDRGVHFKMLSKEGAAPVRQRIVRKDTGEEVPKEERRKAFPLEGGEAVILQPDELESLVPPASREIHLCHFVPKDLLTDQWFDRPYLLGPDGSDDTYFALARAIEERGVHGIARWVMRKKRYLGALATAGDYLTMITLRRSEQVLSLPAVQPASDRSPSDAELKLAQQLVESISGDFAPQEWHNEHRERLRALIAAKAKGQKVVPLRPRAPAPSTDLADALRASIAATRERRVA
jgi:DNA end-binding protein Ku